MDLPPVLDEERVRGLRDPLLAFMRRRVRDPAQAEDLAQEVLLKLWAGLPSLSDHDRLQPFAYRIARNVLIDHYRTRRRATPLDEEEPPAPECELVEDENENQLVGTWLRAFIELLPPEKREAVWLADVEGLKQRKVAERLGLSLSGAKSRIQRGRAELREILEACCTIHVDARGNAIEWQKNDDCC